MPHTFDPLYLEAFERLLARPDPEDLPRRAHALRWEGEPNRRSTRLPPILMSWLQRRFLESDAEEPLPSATRVWTRHARVKTQSPRVLRRTGTAQPGETFVELDRVRSLRFGNAIP